MSAHALAPLYLPYLVVQNVVGIELSSVIYYYDANRDTYKNVHVYHTCMHLADKRVCEWPSYLVFHIWSIDKHRRVAKKAGTRKIDFYGTTLCTPKEVKKNCVWFSPH